MLDTVMLRLLLAVAVRALSSLTLLDRAPVRFPHFSTMAQTSTLMAA
jgi:hypothetical protein